MSYNNNHRTASRSVSRHRAGSSTRYHTDAEIRTFEIVKLINSTEAGRLELGTIRNFLFRDVDPRSNAKFQVIWKHLLQNKENFILSDELKDIRALSGNETVWVRTVLSLCKTHTRLGKDKRNRACDGDCGALHVCRTFLLCSENACPFNSKKKCMFGHSFATDHNQELLKAHHLYGLSDAELQKLFRRRPSRSANTLPQVCIYYNKADGKKCSREDCKSLHLCTDFIQQRCEGNCSRNHKFSTPQVQRVLNLFAFDGSWSSEMLLEDLRHFMTARHRHETGSNGSGDDSDGSESSLPGGGHVPEGAARLASLVNVDTSAPFSSLIGKSQTCGGCEDLKKDMAQMQKTISWLTSQVSDLTKIVENLTLANTNSTRPVRPPGQADADYRQARCENPASVKPTMNGQASQPATIMSPTPASVQSFTRPQPFLYYTSSQPK